VVSAAHGGAGADTLALGHSERAAKSRPARDTAAFFLRASGRVMELCTAGDKTSDNSYRLQKSVFFAQGGDDLKLCIPCHVDTTCGRQQTTWMKIQGGSLRGPDAIIENKTSSITSKYRDNTTVLSLSICPATRGSDKHAYRNEICFIGTCT
jgi:hypothetical protein